jgi:hypothetical protein
MTDSRAAFDPDRLPWLTEERKPRRKGDWSSTLLWALLAALIVAGLFYWLGMQSATEPEATSEIVAKSPRAATVRLPEPAVVEPRAEEVRPAPAPEVQPVAEPAPVRIAQAEPVRKTRAQASRRASARPKARTVSHLARVRAAQAKRPVAARRPAPLQAWPASVSEGAYGRVVRIGAYSTRRQAKIGWWRIVHRYPGMRRLRAVVAPVQSPRTGRIYYRLQFGTTSQAHSEVLCQRMKFISRSCAVIGLPGR